MADLQPPAYLGKDYAILVPAVDADGNEIAGVQPVGNAAPLGTNLPYNYGANLELGDLFWLSRSYIPFHTTRAQRLAAGDERLSLEERYSGLAWAYHMLGNYDEALAMLRRWLPIDRELDEALDRGYEEGGYRAALRRYAETLAARPEAAEMLSWVVAFIYAWAGEKERTLEWLELAYQAHDPNLPGGTITPDFELVHDDPRYHDLRRRMNLPP